jgi:hypothetical protein
MLNARQYPWHFIYIAIAKQLPQPNVLYFIAVQKQPGL